MESADELFPPQCPAGAAIDRRASDLAALAFGIRLEQKAIDLYWRQAEQRTTRQPERPTSFWSKKKLGTITSFKDQWEKAGRAAL